MFAAAELFRRRVRHCLKCAALSGGEDARRRVVSGGEKNEKGKKKRKSTFTDGADVGVNCSLQVSVAAAKRRC